ncbi:MAG TPA: hypothetical protein VN958_03305 [Chitinophagaceae bacterium]|nr:hypothetical protein [Chitinophagaceae bacterium]
MLPTLFEKLQLKDEKNILVQGLPSTIEKQFTKVSFAKNVTPLLKLRKIDFALIFALNQNQLNCILTEVLPALQLNAKLWIAFPKLTSKIVSDLNRHCTWNFLRMNGYESEEQVILDYVWNALQFKRTEIPSSEKFVVADKRKSVPIKIISKRKPVPTDRVVNYL